MTDQLDNTDPTLGGGTTPTQPVAPVVEPKKQMTAQEYLQSKIASVPAAVPVANTIPPPSSCAKYTE